ncbi:plasma membrane calcium-transporting ATPase 2 [Nematostella vectensis]|uniref:plasma membrane calcium-transporting ATPase 2 n=1 Tax=Nematostella vectensis TaxID=45351 RepID=UPI0020777FCC|nr:plasma membrane calcium-transporting ATPase 2 [Nematostella vectensis]
MADQVDAGVPDLAGASKQKLEEVMTSQSEHAKQFIDQNFDGMQTLIRNLRTSAFKGLTGFADNLAHRRQVYGSNEMPLARRRSLFHFLLYSMKDWILIVLVIGAIISLVLGLVYPESCKGVINGEVAWYEGVGILVMVILMILISALSDYLRDADFRCQQKRVHMEERVTVIRDSGAVKDILKSELVVGDLCLLKAGSLVAADGVVVQSSDLVVDETLFSRSERHKSVEDPLVFAGTHVVKGTGKFIVLAVGASTQAMMQLRLGDPASPGIELQPAPAGPINNKGSQNLLEFKRHKEENATLEGKVNRVAVALGYIGIAVALITMIVIMVHFSVTNYYTNEKPAKPEDVNMYVRAFIMGMVVLVVSVPEGLPLAVTFALAFCTKMMYNKQSLVKHMDIIETMGNVSNIYCNKTGVLTEHRMRVDRMFIADQLLDGDPKVYKHKIPSELLDDLFKAISLNTSYSSQIQPAGRDHLPVQVGNKTDCSLLQLMLEMGETYQYWRDDHPEDRFVKVFAFTSERKSMTTVLEKEKDGFYVYTKGAAEILLPRCTSTITTDGKMRPFTDEDRERLRKEVMEEMHKQALKILVLACRSLSDSDKGLLDDEAKVLEDLTLMAVVGIEDPIREKVPEAIWKCDRAGIRVCMVSGDSIQTARAVAARVGILKPDEDILMYTGQEFNSYIRDPDGKVNTDRFNSMWPKLKVLARATARDKYTLVKHVMGSGVNRQGEMVAVTGAGVHDGPVLRKADVGFTMGVSGSDVAKDSADVVLLDDNFGSIVWAIKWGRNVYNTVVKFLMFQFTVTWSAFIVVVIGACVTGRSPLGATQLLWVNLIMDSLASLALTRDFPTDDLLRHQPYGRHKALIGRTLIRNVVGHVIFQLVVMFVLIFKAHEWLDIKDGFQTDTICQPTQHSSLVFTTFVFMQVFNEINSRSVHGRNMFKGIHRNIVFICIWIAQVSIQVLIVEVFTRAFNTKGMDAEQWLWCIFLGLSELIWAQVIYTFPKTWLPLFLRCGVTGHPKGRHINWIRSTSRVDQKDSGPAAAFKLNVADHPPPPATPTGVMPITPEDEHWRGPTAADARL